MKVVVFSPYAGFTNYFATDLEIIEGHLVAGDSVATIVCDHDLESCDINEQHVAHHCLKCIGRRQTGHRQLSPGAKAIRLAELIRAEDRSVIASLPKEFSSVRELQELNLDNFDIGYATLSSMISWRRDSDIDVIAEAETIGRLLRASALVYYALLNYFREDRPERVYLFNGRRAPMRAAFRACEREGIPVYVSEVGCDKRHYSLYENSLPHNIQYVGRRINELWENSTHTIEERTEIASNWFTARARPEVRTNRFIKNQQPGKLPENWDDACHNIVCFNSSSYEFAAIGKEWENPLFPDQEEGLEWIVEQIKSAASDVHFYVRMHPNLTGIDNESTRRLKALTGSHVTVLSPESSISSYGLAEAADTVLTFGSRVGIESAYRETPSVLAGHCFYQDLGATYNPSSRDELLQLLVNKLEPKTNEGALRYAYYFATFGQPFRFYRASSYSKGLFKGHRIRPPWFYQLGRNSLKIAHSVRKIAKKCWPVRRAA